MNQLARNNELYISEKPHRDSSVLVPLSQIRKKTEDEILAEAGDAGKALLLAMYQLQKLVVEMGNQADLDQLMDDYPRLEKLFLLRGDFEAQVKDLNTFLETLAEALGLFAVADLGVDYETTMLE